MEPFSMGMLGLGANLLRPGSNLGDGFAGFQNGLMQGEQLKSQQLYRQAQTASLQAQEQERRLKMQSTMQQQAAMRALMGQLQSPAQGQPPAPPPPQGGDLGSGTFGMGGAGMGGASGGVDPVAKMAQQTRKQWTPEMVQLALAAGYKPDQIQLLAGASDLGRPEVARTIESMDAMGRPQTGQFDKFGQPVGGATRKPYELKLTDRGGFQQYTDPYMGSMVGNQFQKSQSPDSIASNKLGWANHAVAAETARYNRENPSLTAVTTEDGVFQVPNRGGAAKAVIGPDGKPLAGKPPTEGQAAAAGYADRMNAAEEIIGSTENGRSTDRTRSAAAVPLVGRRLERGVMSVEQAKVKQAEDDWIRSKLRKESGAVIGEDEAEQERITYFPQPGDPDEVVKQKAAARRLATNAMQRMAGGGYKPPATMPKPDGERQKSGSISNLPPMSEIDAELKRRGAL